MLNSDSRALFWLVLTVLSLTKVSVEWRLLPVVHTMGSIIAMAPVVS